MSNYKEGRATINYSGKAFLNPKMSMLRDISVLFLKALNQKDARLLDSTAATGIRGIRYSLEAGARDVTFIDINKDACRSIRANVKKNKVKAKVIGQSIQEFSASGAGPFDIIDLDPFGSPVPHIHDLLKISGGETTMMVTATDTAVLCGAHYAACLKIYGARPMHNELCKEAGIRILLGFIAREAAQFNFGIDVRLSISDLHYMRVFVTLKRGADLAVGSIKQMGFLASCRSCHGFQLYCGIIPEIVKKCPNCGAARELAGPMWLGPLCDRDLLSRMVRERGYDDARRYIESVQAEPDDPFFYSVPSLTRSAGTGSVSPKAVIDKLGKRGYRTSPTQFEKEAVKTSAPLSEVEKAVRSLAA